MSRSGLVDANGIDDNIEVKLWRRAVLAAINDRRGQAFLCELRDALDAMPVKELIADELHADGEYCALGVLGAKRGINLDALDVNDYTDLGEIFDVDEKVVQEIEWVNDQVDDDPSSHEALVRSRAERWKEVRRWLDKAIK